MNSRESDKSQMNYFTHDLNRTDPQSLCCYSLSHNLIALNIFNIPYIVSMQPTGAALGDL